MWDRVDVGEIMISVLAGWGPYYNDPNGLLELYEPVNGYFKLAKNQAGLVRMLTDLLGKF